MPYLFTLPGPRDGPDTISTWITPAPGSHYIVEAGTKIYASLRRVYWADHNEIDFTNHGTSWNIAPGEPTYGGSAVSGFYLTNIVNTGTIIVEAPVGNASAIFVGSLADTVNNSGSIYAIANGNAEAIFHWSPDVVITNSGLIVAYAPSATPGTGGGGVGSALAIGLANGGLVHNLAGGRILAEGLWATAVGLGRGSLYGGETLQNAGLIEAHSLTPGRPSYGITAGGDAHFSHHFYNTGIVRADIVWSSYSPPSVYYGYAAKAPDTIVNETGGRLIGDIETGYGTDQVLNRGMIDGDVRLGDENDDFNTELGSFAGVADLGWHDDFFRGSAGSDIAKGNRGRDNLAGNGRKDLLLGGVGRDVLTGGAGNDALYGEYGNDRIEVEGGDNAFGGDGDDLMVANDLTFRLIAGGAGADTLHLAVGARNLDLGAAIASGRLQSIEHIELQSGQQLAVRAGNVAALAGGALDISGGGANQVHLVGGWTEGAASVRGGETWRSFTLAGETVFVKSGVAVLTGAAEPGYAGLDAVAAGDAPLPAGAEMSSNVLNITYYDLHTHTFIEAEEIWQASNAPIIWASLGVGMVNEGMILMTADNLGSFIAAVQGQRLGLCVNSGTIRTVATGNNGAAAYSAQGYAPLENIGLIEAIAVGGQAQACELAGGFVNRGAIVARSQTGSARGVVINGGDAALNAGSIEATGGAGTVGLRLSGGTPLINEGTIVAQNSAASGAHDALAIQLYQGSLDNRGTITGVVAIWSDHRADVVTNSGRITGDILMNAGNDRLTNNGEIVGTIDLGEGNDVYDGVGATARVVVIAGAGNDTLTGGAFADVLGGGAGADTMAGGAGDDSIIVDNVLDQAIEAAGGGRDSVFTTVSYVLAADAEIEVLAAYDYQGTQAINLTGNALGQLIEGNAGANVLNGGGGNDELVGLGGNDTLIGSSSAGTMWGGTGNDTYYVMDGSDAVIDPSSEGFDRIVASVSYVLPAYSEIEILEAITLSATDALNFTGNVFINTLIGNSGANVLNGGGGNDTLFGLGGNDILIGASSASTLYGGTGNDIYYIADTSDAVIEAVGEGADRIAASASYALVAGSEIETLEALTQGATDALNFTGNAFNNTLIGNAGANVLTSGGGNDTMLGRGGNDTLIGSSFASAMYGGIGNDTYNVRDAQDIVIDLSGEGHDRVAASVSYTLAPNSEIEILEALILSATDALNFTGNVFINTLIGNNGANILNGGGGNDVLFGQGGNDTFIGSSSANSMYGGTGNDTYYVRDTSDAVIDLSGEGADRIAASASYTLAANSEIETLEAITQSATDALNFTGNFFINTLIGNNGANVLNGGGGNDVLLGLGGADIFAFTSALGAGHVVLIADFSSGSDRIALDDAAFSGLAPGALAAGAFRAGTAAVDGDDRIIYNGATGQIFFDADGSGSSTAILFATLNPGTNLAASDFTVI